jgi:hypothetical protein
MSRRKRVQIGWYCDHRNELFGSHIGDLHKSGRIKKDVPIPSTFQSLTFLDWQDAKRVPACPKAEPVYVYRSAE